jgi:hypothetical protein
MKTSTDSNALTVNLTQWKPPHMRMGCQSKFFFFFFWREWGTSFRLKPVFSLLIEDYQDCAVSYFIICNICNYDSFGTIFFLNIKPQRTNKMQNQINSKMNLHFSVTCLHSALEFIKQLPLPCQQ